MEGYILELCVEAKRSKQKGLGLPRRLRIHRPIAQLAITSVASGLLPKTR